MRATRWGWLLVCLATIGTLLTSGCAATGNSDLPETRVLFIGNSFTDFNGGIDQVLHGLAPRTTTERVAPGGYTLGKHLTNATTMSRLRAERWTYVVIQEQSQYPVVARGNYLTSLRKLVAEVRALGAKPLLLMTWARPDDSRVTTTALQLAVRAAAETVKATVVPAGTAFATSLAARPDIKLNQIDGHPTAAGTYLAGCVVYAEIFSESPQGNTFTGGVDAQVAGTLQATAEKVVRN